MEMWWRFKAIDHPKCVIGLFCETPAASEGGPAEGDEAEGGPGKGTQKSKGPTP